MNKLTRLGTKGLVIFLIGVLTSSILAQQKVDQAKVSKAINKGRTYLLDYLKNQSGSIDPRKEKTDPMKRYADELILYTLIHADVDPDNEEFKKVLERVLNEELKLTYRVSLLAMALEALDRQKYQDKIAQCGKFLVDQQCKNGQWSYGKPMKGTSKVTPSSTPSTSKEGETIAVKRIKIKKDRRAVGPERGDNSNTQYALLGLRACMEADVIIPKRTFQTAQIWFTRNQNSDGGWSYGGKHAKKKDSYGSMTAGSMGALVICEYYLKRNHKKNRFIRKAIKWLDKNFTVTENPKIKGQAWLYYYLYALERAGRLYGTKTFGSHEWYPLGAEYLIEHQDPDGSWPSAGWASPAVETCFAILFLRRATKPIISDGSK